MKNFFNKITKLLFNRSYHFKMFIMFSVFTIIIVLTLSFTLITYYNNNSKKEIHKSNERLLTQIQIYCDNNLIEKIHLETHREYINTFFDYSYDRYTISALSKIYRNLEIAVNVNDYYESVYLYRKDMDMIISSKEGLNFDVTSSHNPYKDLLPLAFIDKIMNAEKLPLWATPYENINFYDNNRIISFAQSVPLFSDIENRLGCVIVNVNVEKVFEKINKIYTEDIEKVLIIDSAGRLLADSNHSELLNTLYDNNQFNSKSIKEVLNSDMGFIVSKINDYPVGITWMKSNINDWKYISIVPMNVLNDSINVTKRLALFLILFGILINLIGIKLITMKLYKPIGTLINSTKKCFNGIEKNENEILFIDNVINNLSSKVSEMENLLDNNEKLIRYKLCTDIIHGKTKNTESANKQLKLVHDKFEYSNYYLLFIENNKKMHSQLPIEQKEFVNFKIIEITQKYFKTKDVVCLSISHPSNCVTSIVNCNEGELNHKNLHTLMHLLEIELGLTYNISVSNSTSDLFDLCTKYRLLKKSLTYTFIYGYSNFFTENDLIQFEQNNGPSTLTKLNKLEYLLKTRDMKGFEDEINQTITDIKENGYSYQYLQSFLLQLLNIISNMSNQLNLDFDKKKILSEFTAITFLDDCIIWIYHIIEVYFKQLTALDKKINHDYIGKIITYVSNNIDSQISLKVVADEFNMSTPYLSKVFQEYSGVGFSDFVKTKKLEKASILLIERDDLDISTISEMLGYTTKSYFAKLFKTKYGLTPLQYRKKNTHSDLEHK